MVMDAYGVLYILRKWSMPENVDSKKSNPLTKKRAVQNAIWTKIWLKIGQQKIYQIDPNFDENEFERAFVNESLPELRQTKQKLFWNR